MKLSYCLLLGMLITGMGRGQKLTNPMAHPGAPCTISGTPGPHGEVVCVGAPKPEPMDVPAIQVPAKSRVSQTTNCDTESLVCFEGILSCTNHGELTGEAFEQVCKNGYIMSCADKSRILLTDESGGKHCVKFPKD